jgi:hypothetical protein
VLFFTPKHPWFALPVFLVMFVGVWFHPYPVGLDVFGRNLTYDLQAVADSPAERNLVFQYHSLAHFYAHNELVNTDRSPKSFEIIRQVEGDDDPMSRPIDPMVREAGMKPGDGVWCVIPYHLGEGSLRACKFDDPAAYEQIVELAGQHATVKGYRVR